MGQNNAASIGFGIALATSVAIASRLVGIVANFAMIAILSPDQYGLFIGVQAIVFVGSGFCDLGLSHAYRQQVSRIRNLRRQLLGSTIFIQFLALVIYFFGVSYYLAGKEMFSGSVVFIALGAIVSQLPEVVGIELTINRRFKELAYFQMLLISGLVLGLLIAIMVPDKLAGLAVGYLLGSLLSVTYSVIKVGYSNFTVRFNRDNVKQFRVGVPFFASIVISRVGQYFGVAYLLSVEGPYLAGIFGLSLKIYQVMLLVTTASTGIVLPYFHKLASEMKTKELGSATRKLIGPLWVVSICFSGVVILIPNEIISVIGSGRFSESTQLLPIFGLAFIFKSLSIPAGNLLEGRGLQWIRVCVQTLSTSIIVFSILFLFPKFGLAILAYSILVADVVSFIALWGINAYGMFKALPWAIHFKSLLIFGTGILISIYLPIQNIQSLMFFLVYSVMMASAWKIWSPSQLIKQLRR